MPTAHSHDLPRSRRDDERLEEIRRLFDRYRRLARDADGRLERRSETAAAPARKPESVDRRR
jgi:hypothetical protein